MATNNDVRFISPPPHRNSIFTSARSNFAKLPFNFNFDSKPINLISQFLNNQPFFHRNVKRKRNFNTAFKKPMLFCSAALALSDSESQAPASSQSKGRDDSGAVPVTQSKNVSTTRAAEEERVLISEVLVWNKDGEELERKDWEAEAVNALKAARANSALTVREVQEDVHRIIASGYFMSCMPVAVDTRDGIRLIFQNQTKSF